MDVRRWTAKVFQYLHTKSVDTLWLKKYSKVTYEICKDQCSSKDCKITKKETRTTEQNN